MKKKQVKRKLVNGSGERVLTWMTEDDQRLFSASNYYPDGHGGNFLLTKTILDKDKSLTVEMRMVSKGGKAMTASCILEKESINMLINVLNSQIATMTTFESNDDMVSIEN